MISLITTDTAMNTSYTRFPAKRVRNASREMFFRSISVCQSILEMVLYVIICEKNVDRRKRERVRIL